MCTPDRKLILLCTFIQNNSCEACALPGRASSGPGRRRRAGPRLARDGTAGPGLDWTGTAPPGRASTGPGLRPRAGPPPPRDVAAAGPGLDWTAPPGRRQAGPSHITESAGESAQVRRRRPRRLKAGPPGWPRRRASSAAPGRSESQRVRVTVSSSPGGHPVIGSQSGRTQRDSG